MMCLRDKPRSSPTDLPFYKILLTIIDGTTKQVKNKNRIIIMNEISHYPNKMLFSSNFISIFIGITKNLKKK